MRKFVRKLVFELRYLIALCVRTSFAWQCMQNFYSFDRECVGAGSDYHLRWLVFAAWPRTNSRCARWQQQSSVSSAVGVLCSEEAEARMAELAGVVEIHSWLMCSLPLLQPAKLRNYKRSCNNVWKQTINAFFGKLAFIVLHGKWMYSYIYIF